jgi:hypothetical protein
VTASASEVAVDVAIAPREGSAVRAGCAIILLATMAATARADEPEPQPEPAAAPEQSAAPEPSPPPAVPEPPATPEPPKQSAPDYARPVARDVVIVSPGVRSRRNLIELSLLAGGAVALGAIGLGFNLDAQSASNAVSAQTFTSRTWSPQLQAEYDRANRSSTATAVFYSLGGGLLAAAIVVLIATEPAEQRTVIHPHVGATFRGPSLSANANGAAVGGAWSF